MMSHMAVSTANENIGGTPKPLINSTYLAMFMFIGAELMFFSGFIGAFLLLRLSSADWPPVDQPTLPSFITGINTIVLLFSGYVISKVWNPFENQKAVIRNMLLASAFGLLFLTVQGYEWIRLIGFGLTLQSSVYGAIFYLLIGAHGLHVLGGLLWLFAITILTIRSGIVEANLNKLRAAFLYWFFVVLLWPILYFLVYF